MYVYIGAPRPSEPYIPVVGPHCGQSYYGCCPDGHTTATGPRSEGCAQDDCIRTRYTPLIYLYIYLLYD